MHYVKHFNINNVDTRQVACIELQGKPNSATEGSVGVLGVDMTSPSHDVYKCVAVNGSIYTWELLSSGMSIISSTTTGEGTAIKSFPYDSLRFPNLYIVKVGDLILDCGGYLYQITSLGATTCDATYTGIHFGVSSFSGKCSSLEIKDGKIQLISEQGNVLSSIDYLVSDNGTIYRNPNTGEATVVGVQTITGNVLKFFVGTQEEYNQLPETQKKNLFAIISDTTKDRVELGVATAGEWLDFTHTFKVGRVYMISFAILDDNGGGASYCAPIFMRGAGFEHVAEVPINILPASLPADTINHISMGVDIDENGAAGFYFDVPGWPLPGEQLKISDIVICEI